MPREMFAFQTDEDNSPTLTRSPESQSSMTSSLGASIERPVRKDLQSLTGLAQLRSKGANISARNDLHPYVQTLSLADVDSCVALENAAFPENERCSREKFNYRLSACSELCLGLFSTFDADAPTSSVPTYATARPTNSAAPTKKAVLIAHIVATKCESKTITDRSMDCPPDWQSSAPPSDGRGHQEHGRTIAVHSVAVLPQYQGRHLGSMTLKSYLQRMETAGIADRISLLAHQPLFKFYEGLGFESQGPSECKSYGGGWHDLVRRPVLRSKLSSPRLDQGPCCAFG
ncbi:hypothetical protein MMC07_006759 [Pseudocyphellaria aurata]|nr:hypothetical protein [Pseudocyphellaria aurata]